VIRIDPVESFTALYDHLLRFREQLRPAIVAPALPLKQRSKDPPAPIERADVELFNKAA
jgi:hypothetical protein